MTNELLTHLRSTAFWQSWALPAAANHRWCTGVIPALRKETIEIRGHSSCDWPVHIITPGDEPLKALAATLTRNNESVTVTATLFNDLRSSNQSLDLFLYRQMTMQGNARLVLVLDQFEELFTQCNDLRTRRLARLLSHAWQCR